MGGQPGSALDLGCHGSVDGAGQSDEERGTSGLLPCCEKKVSAFHALSKHALPMQLVCCR